MDTPLVSMLEKTLDGAFEDAVCSQLWLGYGDTLFVGFGKEALSPIDFGKPHPLPTYEVQTFFADWCVEQNAVSLDENSARRFQATEASSVLLNSRVVAWKFDGSCANLTVSFENHTVLQILAWSPAELEAEQQNTDAWVVRLPNAAHFAVSCTGMVSFDGET